MECGGGGGEVATKHDQLKLSLFLRGVFLVYSVILSSAQLINLLNIYFCSFVIISQKKPKEKWEMVLLCPPSFFIIGMVHGKCCD